MATSKLNLKKIRKLRNKIEIYKEWNELCLENQDNKADAKYKEAERQLMRQETEKSFDSIDLETIKASLLESRTATENKKYFALQRDAILTGKALSDKQSAKLTEDYQKRIQAVKAGVEKDIAALASQRGAGNPAPAKDLTAELSALRKSADDEAASKKKAINDKNQKKIVRMKQELEKAERRAETDCASDKQDDLPADCTLSVKDLKMYFGGVKAVDGLSFDVKEGEIFGLIGPNGAGKTTVFNCITQFYKPTAGSLLFRGQEGEVIDLTKEKVHDVILHGIVRTFQNVEVVPEMSVLENLLVAGHRQFSSGVFASALHLPSLALEEKVIRARAMRVLDFMGLTPYKDNYAFGLPYGVLKKIEMARTLMCSPRLIILDEPAAGLNDTETADLAQLIRRIRDEYHCTILLVEHDMGLVMDVCDNICAISFGKLLAYGTPEQIQSDKNVQQAYLGVDEEGE